MFKHVLRLIFISGHVRSREITVVFSFRTGPGGLGDELEPKLHQRGQATARLGKESLVDWLGNVRKCTLW